MRTLFKFVLVVFFLNCLVPGNAQELKIRSKHPKLILSEGDIRAMKKNISRTGSVVSRFYSDFIAGLDEKMENWKPSPYFENNHRVFYKHCQRDGGMARDLAIAYVASGDRKYAEKALSIFSAWLDGNKLPGSRLAEGTEEGGIGMFASRAIFPFLYAYDLLQTDGLFAPELDKAFREWIGSLVPVIKEGAFRWKWNNYYDHQYYQNHMAAETMGLLLIGILLDDQGLVDYAFSSIENERDVLEIVQGTILMEGQKPYYREIGTWPVHDGEIIDRYRHFQLAGHYKDYVTKPNRGLQYCNLTTIMLVISAEACRLNGFDLYSWVGEYGENISLPLKFYADFYIGHTCGDGIYSGEEFFINANDTATSALWEVASKRYPKEEKFRMVLESNDRIEEAYLHLLGPVLLTHGI